MHRYIIIMNRGNFQHRKKSSCLQEVFVHQSKCIQNIFKSNSSCIFGLICLVHSSHRPPWHELAPVFMHLQYRRIMVTNSKLLAENSSPSPLGAAFQNSITFSGTKPTVSKLQCSHPALWTTGFFRALKRHLYFRCLRSKVPVSEWKKRSELWIQILKTFMERVTR